MRILSPFFAATFGFFVVCFLESKALILLLCSKYSGISQKSGAHLKILFIFSELYFIKMCSKLKGGGG